MHSETDMYLNIIYYVIVHAGFPSLFFIFFLKQQ